MNAEPLVHEAPQTGSPNARRRSQDADSVSVIMPAYNAERYIAESLESALNQTVVPAEILVIDDGSSDRTVEIAESFGSSVRVLRRQNGGHAAARNQGLAEARGEWMGVLDADDIWEPDKLEKQLAAADSADIVYTNVLNFDESERVQRISFPDNKLPEGDLLRALLKDNFITHSSVLVRISSVLELGGYDESLLSCCDWDLWLRLAAAGSTFRACPEPLTRYRWRSGSNSRRYHLTCRNRLEIQNSAFEHLANTPDNARYRRQCLAGTWNTSAWFVTPHDERLAFLWYLRSAIQYPWQKTAWAEMLRIGLHFWGVSRSRIQPGADDRYDSAPLSRCKGLTAEQMKAALHVHRSNRTNRSDD